MTLFKTKKIDWIPPKINLATGENIAIRGMLELAFLSMFKVFAWLMSGTVLLLADAVNTITDIISMSASYIGLHVSRKRSNKSSFGYGYYKVESLAAFIVSLITIYLAYQVFAKSYRNLFIIKEITHPWLAILVMLLSIIMSYKMAKELKKVGTAINSPSLINNSEDRFMNIFASLAVISGIVAGYFKIPYSEGIIGIILSFLIMKVGFKEARNSLFSLLDYWDDPKLRVNMRNVLKKYQNTITEIQSIKLRRAGSVIFSDIFITINPFINITTLGTKLEMMQLELRELNPYFKDIMIFTSIPVPEKVRMAIPIKKNHGLSSEIAKHFGSIQNYIFVDLAGNKIDKFYVKPFGFKENEYAEIAKFLEEEEINVIIVPDIHSLVYCHLQAKSFVRMYPPFQNFNRVSEIVKLVAIK